MDEPKSAVVQNGRFEVWEDGTRTECAITRTGRKKNYCLVTCRVDGKQKHFYVHRLVAEAFLSNPLNLPLMKSWQNTLQSKRADTRIEEEKK